METGERKEVNDTVIFARDKGPKRNRPRIGLTLAKETTERLEAMVASEEATSLSRAIDLAVEFYDANKNAVPVQFESPQRKQKFLLACLNLKKKPSEILTNFVNQFMQGRD